MESTWILFNTLFLNIFFALGLIFASGYLVRKLFFGCLELDRYLDPILLFILGTISVSLLSILAILVGKQYAFIWPTLLALLLIFLIKLSFVRFRAVLQFITIYCLAPFLLLQVTYGSFLLAHQELDQIKNGIDPWILTERISGYHAPDHYLQWIISENFYNQLPMETGFKRKRAQIWSAGDRPLFIGFLNAGLSLLTGSNSINLYFLRIITFTSLLFISIYTLLRLEFHISSLRAVLITTALGFNNFIFTNMLYTWPKLAGVGFALAGMLLIIQSHKELKLMMAAGLAFAIAMLCHTSALFAIIGVLAYVAITRRKVILNNLNLTVKALSYIIVPALLLMAAHSYYVKTHTKPSGLLMRVQLCRHGSYAHATKKIPLQKACLEYIERVGISGVINDRMESFKWAFMVGYKELSATTKQILTGEFVSALKSWDRISHALVPAAYGISSLWLGVLSIFIWIYKSSSISVLFSPRSVIFILAPILLALYSTMLAEYTEMRSHVAPYIIPVFMQLGCYLLLEKVLPLLFWIYLSGSTALSITMILLRGEELFVYPSSWLLIITALSLLASAYLTLNLSKNQKILN